MNKADEQVLWTCFMNKVDAQIFSLSLYELMFQVWLTSVEFEQSYWPFCFLLLMNKADEQVWCTCQMNKVDAHTFSLSLYELKFQVWLTSIEFEQSY